MKKLLLIVWACTLLWGCGKTGKQNEKMDEKTVNQTIEAVKAQSSLSPLLIEKGVRQTASLWRAQDGTPQDFTAFCTANICKDEASKKKLFDRCCANFEAIYGACNRISQDLQRPLQLVGYDSTQVDNAFAAYSPTAHLSDDMFANKIAFVVALNFPFFTLDEKNSLGEKWSATEWGYARLGDTFTDRVPADVLQKITTSLTLAEDYISNYNIYMNTLVNEKGDTLFPPIKLLSHWGLRDEIKSDYAEGARGFAKQQMIYEVMKRVIDQTIPQEVINNAGYRWNPVTNKLFKEGKEVKGTPEGGRRYSVLLGNFKVMKEADSYYSAYPNYIDRHFSGTLEISADDAEKMFTTLCSSPVAAEVGKIIAARLGRPLQPYDLWYDGFKERSAIDPTQLDKIVREKYPTLKAFADDLPNILQKMGFTAEKAQFIASHVTVEASVGSGHAWQSLTRRENALLRTRVYDNGMDYKAYNIGTHEFGHNVEEIISLFDVENYFLTGIPNDAFTEALAFVFQYKDLDLLGIKNVNPQAENLRVLNLFWDCYEIMGVSLLDIATWRWMYAHPEATPGELQTAVISMAKEIWNKYYAPVFGTRDEPLLAVYSHAIELALYLPAYPIGHLIDFQLEDYFKDKNIGSEVSRIYSIGKLTPQVWMKRALGSELSPVPLIEATRETVQKMKK